MIRPPKEAEKTELIYYLLTQIGAEDKGIDDEEYQQQRGFVDNAVIAVEDRYVSDGPGYFGKVMLVMWSGSPNFYEAFTWDRDGKIKKEDCEFSPPHQSEAERKLQKKLLKMTAMAQLLIDVIVKAHDMHIYDEDDEHPDDCGYCAAVEASKTAIAEVLNG